MGASRRYRGIAADSSALPQKLQLVMSLFASANCTAEHQQQQLRRSCCIQARTPAPGLTCWIGPCQQVVHPVGSSVPVAPHEDKVDAAIPEEHLQVEIALSVQHCHCGMSWSESGTERRPMRPLWQTQCLHCISLQ